MHSKKSGSLTGQLFRRIVAISSIAVFSMLVTGVLGLLFIQMLAQRDLDRSGSKAARNADLFMADIAYHIRSVGNAMQTGGGETMFQFMFAWHPGIFEMLQVDLQGEIVLQSHREGSSAVSTGTQVTEQPWLATIQTGEVYIGPIESSASGVPYIDIAGPIAGETGAITGAVVARFDLIALREQVVNLTIGETGYTYLVDNYGRIVAAKDLKLVQTGANINDLVGHSPKSITDGSVLGLFNFYTGIEDKRVVGSGSELTIVPWYAISEQPYTEALGDFIPIFGVLIAVLIASLVLVYSTGRFVRRNIAIPLGEIAHGLQVFRSGDLSYEMVPHGTPEVRELMSTINEIAHELDYSATQLAETNQTLEARVAERSRYLETVAQVVTQTSTILNVKQLLQAVVDLTKANFELYHAHVYLLNETGTRLELAAGAGEIGKILTEQGHQISLQSVKSVVASAGRTQSLVIVNDVTTAPDFLPNPLLPATKSELAAALVARGELIGVLDVQSAEIDHFGPELQTVMRTLAQQIAAALSNARLYSEVERTSRQEQALSLITREMQTASSIEDVLQTAARELGKALQVPYTTIALHVTEPAAEDKHGTNLQVAHD